LVELTRAFNVDAATAAFVLRLHGWTRDPVRVTRHNRRELHTFWVPPDGKSVPRRRRGRPSFTDLFPPT
jgi:hypothetical protein